MFKVKYVNKTDIVDREKLIPENIKEGIEINGVIGTLKAGSNETGKYTLLDYIASTGTQYIDTGLTFSNSYFGYDIKFRLTEITQEGSILGINKSVSSLSINSSKFMLNGTNLTNADTDVHILEYDRATGIANLDGQEYSIATSLVDVGDNVSIFRRSGSATSNTKLELYYFKLYDINRILLRDFIPVKDEEGVVCLYDRVSKEFFYNAGTGNFIAS